MSTKELEKKLRLLSQRERNKRPLSAKKEQEEAEQRLREWERLGAEITKLWNGVFVEDEMNYQRNKTW